jgi:hypothetical protein
MGNDEAALLRLWREKRGELEPEDLIVQLGLATEALNQCWYEANTGPDHRGRTAARPTPGTPLDGVNARWPGRGEAPSPHSLPLLQLPLP